MSAHVASPSMLDSGQRHHELVAAVHCRQIWHVHLGKLHLQVSGCEISRLPRCWPCRRVLYRVGKGNYLHYGPKLCLFIVSLILAQHVSLPTAGARLVAVAATLLLSTGLTGERRPVPVVNGHTGDPSATTTHLLLSGYWEDKIRILCIMEFGPVNVSSSLAPLSR
jgi:hypothetical protein